MTSQSVKQQVVMRFAELAQLGLEEAEKYTHLCTASADEFLVRLKGVPDPNQRERLLDLFAASAYHRYCCLRMARQQYSQMTLSDVSVKNEMKSGCEAALTLKNLLLEGCADILTAKSGVIYNV